jgi:hypothetical protein
MPRINGIRRFILVHTPEGSFGVWVNEYDILIQVPKTHRDWMRSPFADFRKEMRSRGYTVEETKKEM